MLQKKITRISFSIALLLVGLMWVSYFLDQYFQLDLYRFGIYPLKTEGLIGIIASPFIHSSRDIGHILNNSIPMFILSWMLFYHYRIVATRALLLIYLFTGIGVWLMGRESYHIGMSGVIYGLTSFLTFSGFFRRSMRVAAISLVVIFLYGSTVWGIFPIKVNMSWEAHLMGLFAGIVAALIFRKAPPQPGKMQYEIEEELGIEPEHEYWKNEPDNRQQINQPKIILKYDFIPKRPEVINPDDEEE